MRAKKKKLMEFKTPESNDQTEQKPVTDIDHDTLHFEQQMAEDLDNVIAKWHGMGIPKAKAVVFPSMYWVNFVFSCVDPLEANYILSKALSREILRQGEINRDEIKVQ